MVGKRGNDGHRVHGERGCFFKKEGDIGWRKRWDEEKKDRGAVEENMLWITSGWIIIITGRTAT